LATESYGEMQSRAVEFLHKEENEMNLNSLRLGQGIRASGT
jgi:hypothetical protein